MNSPTQPAIKFLQRVQPDFTETEARRIAADIYGLDGEFRPLLTERDMNFRIRAASGEAFVLKISNHEEDPGVVDFQTAALLHIAEQDPGLPVPRVVPTLSGETVASVRGRSGAEHLVRALTYLPGKPCSELPRPPQFWWNLGGLLARLDLALRGFFHPSARHDLLWDLRRIPDLRHLTSAIPHASSRRSIDRIFEHTSTEILPRLRSLRHQVIHADVYADNTIAPPDDPTRITGIIDFGDMIHAPLVAEVAIAADLDTVPAAEALDCLAELVAGYDRVLPLEEEELEMVYPLVLARNAATAAILAWRRAHTPDQPPYVGISEAAIYAFIDHFEAVGEAVVDRRLRTACRFPPRSRPFPEAGENHALIDRRRAILGRHSPLFYAQPVHIERSRGPWLFGTDGSRFLDAYNNVPVAGHAHPHVVQAIARQAAVLNTNTRYLYEALFEYAERLVGTLALPLTMCVFVNSGSEANDIAWQIARHATGSRGALVMEEAYHGISEAIRDLSPATEDRPLAPHVRTLENPDPYRGRFRSWETDLAEKYAADADRAIASMAGSGLRPAAFMVDSAFVSSGIPDVPEGYLLRVAEKVRAAGGLVIADEVQAGFGRSGTHLWGHAAHGLQPDIVTMGKPVGNGFPLGVVVTSPEILEPFMADTGLFSTFGGNPVACAAGLAVLDVVEREALVQNAFVTGHYLRAGIRALMSRYPLIGDVRGRGLLAGVELVRDRATMEPAREETRRVLDLMRQNGVLIGSEGLLGNVLKIRPPLVFRQEHADILIAELDRTMAAL